ncbi:hypothetical protein BD410DRAFT_764173 [Rickenella mellea]|uniref:chitin synthase n=1 Tax=Rickenella mellea TaxID=50990 RepID=A0A4Y7QFF7_9AGAM|nr:hypothetical protein BD410DRAFT_764173 [Rickenella mellea]
MPRNPIPPQVTNDHEQDDERRRIRTPIDPQLKRYSLSDLPIPPAPSAQITYDAIDTAISRMQHHGDEPSRYNTPEADVSGEYSQYDGSGDGSFEQGSNPGSERRRGREYETPPVLPTINTGETLDLSGVYPNQQDPFTDTTRVATPHESHAYPLPPSSGYQSAYSSPQRTQTPYSQYSYYDSPTRPVSAAPYHEHVSKSPGSEYYANYAQPRLVTAPSYTERPPGSAYSPIRAHGEHTGAYSSGIYPRQAFGQARSRSATPAGDDDYHVGNNTMDLIRDFGYDQPIDEKAVDVTDARAQYLHVSAGDLSEKSPGLEYPETPVETRHFGPAPTGRVVRRHKTKKRVQLTNGNLVVDINVPTKLVLGRRGEDEMLKTRYTAVTCDPDDFERNNFFLRQNESGRKTELFIVITMYNEDEILFCRTLYGVMRNISHLCTRKNSQTWGQDAWKKVVVCIVSDGRKKIHPRVLDCLAALGVYQNGDFMKNMVNNKPVTAHLFEYTTSFALDDKLHFRYPDEGIVPTQILFCLKEKNQKKINSHRWFFNAFAPLLQPNVCVLLDVGTRPGNKSLYHLWKTFDLNSNVGGACGEIAAYKGKRWKELLNPLVASQNFEYKMSNILDKPTESLFGYISVLPGAFSAYRYIALQNDKHGVGPLASYFKGEVLHGRDTDIFTSNMYLAEDRILCFELIARANADWVLRYVKSAIGETDVPDALPEFISQRRRWLNGSFFAAVYAIAHTRQILRSGHSFGRKMVLLAETVYNIINLTFSWFAMGNFYLFFVILTSSLDDASFNLNGLQFFNSVVQYIYASILVACFLFSMGNKPKASPWKYKLSAIIFAGLTFYMIICAIVCASRAAGQGGAVYSTMVFSILATYGVYAFSSLLAFDPWHLLTSFIPYLMLSPTYINILNIYAFSNLDDISWGTKQDTTVESDLGAVVQNSHSQVDVEVLAEAADVNQMYDEALYNIKTRKQPVKPSNVPNDAERDQTAKDYYANVRTNVLLAWVLSNGLLVLAILAGGDSSSTFSGDAKGSRTKTYLTFILAFVAITSSIRFCGSTIYLIARVFTG